MHTLGVQQCEFCPSDNCFETRRRVQTYSCAQVVQDFLDQLERSFGHGLDPFLAFVGTCDPKKALNINQVDISMAKVTHNDRLERLLEETFVCHYLCKDYRTNNLVDLFRDLKAFGLVVPGIPPMRF